MVFYRGKQAEEKEFSTTICKKILKDGDRIP